VEDTILFDIDYTLINSSDSKIIRRNKISDLSGFSIEKILEVENSYVKSDSGFTDFNPDDYIVHISKALGVDFEKVKEIFFSDDVFTNALYSDVNNSLEKIHQNYECGVFSEGFEDFQLIKLHKSGILHFFKKEITFIFRRKLTVEVLNLLPENCFIIDDNPSVISALVEAGRFRPIWLNRKTKEKHGECKTTFDLTDIGNALENYSSIK